MTTPGEVSAFHTLSDVDSRENAQHHTIGTGVYQAASGRKLDDLTKTVANLNAMPFKTDNSHTIDPNALAKGGLFQYSPGSYASLPNATSYWEIYSENYGGRWVQTAKTYQHGTVMYRYATTTGNGISQPSDWSPWVLETFYTQGSLDPNNVINECNYAYSPGQFSTLPDQTSYWRIATTKNAGRWAQTAQSPDGVNAAYRYSATVDNGTVAASWTAWKFTKRGVSNYTPTYTNFSLGNGTLTYCIFRINDNQLIVQFYVILGSTSALSGDFVISWPDLSPYGLSPSLGSGGIAFGTGRAFDSSSGTYYDPMILANQTGIYVRFKKPDANGYTAVVPASASIPIPWGASDVIQFSVALPIS